MVRIFRQYILMTIQVLISILPTRSPLMMFKLAYYPMITNYDAMNPILKKDFFMG